MYVTPLARQYAPWSISKAGSGETCPLQFAYKYVDRVPETTVVSANQVGTVAHTVLELRVGGMDGEAAKQAALEKLPLTSTEVEQLDSFEEAIEAFLVRFDGFCKRNGVQEVLLEAEWGITEDFKPAGFWDKDVFFRGKVDLAAVTRDKDLIVVDHKSGIARDIAQGMKFKYQLNSYAVLALANRPDLAGVRGGIHFLQGAEEKRLQWLEYNDVRRIKTLYVPWLFGYIDYVAERLKPPFAAKPAPKWPCAYCSFKSMCPAYAEMMNDAQI